MRSTNNKKLLLLLVEPESQKTADVRVWLTNKGLRTWWANDVSHAIEELSDFTVKYRPDVIMLEATPLSACLESLRQSLCGPGGRNDVSVVAMGGKSTTSPSGKFFAADLAQLEIIMDRESGMGLC